MQDTSVRHRAEDGEALFRRMMPLRHTSEGHVRAESRRRAGESFAGDECNGGARRHHG